MTLSCLQESCECVWSLAKYSWIYNWDITKKKCLDFGDLDLIFKVTAVENLKILWCGMEWENTVTCII